MLLSIFNMFYFIISCIFSHTYFLYFFFFFSSRRRHTRLQGDWSSDVCSSDLLLRLPEPLHHLHGAHGARRGARGGADETTRAVMDRRSFVGTTAAMLAGDRKSVV